MNELLASFVPKSISLLVVQMVRFCCFVCQRCTCPITVSISFDVNLLTGDDRGELLRCEDSVALDVPQVNGHY